MQIERWQALGNEYLIVERDRLPFPLTPAAVSLLCSTDDGYGSDGVLELGHDDEGGTDAELVIWNSDGSQAELSGNGARQAFLYLRASGWSESDSLAIRTAAGVVTAELTGPDSATVAMGKASTTSAQFPGGSSDGLGMVDVDGFTGTFQFVSIGNPQCSFELSTLDELERLDLTAVGPAIETDERFPGRTNVSWWVRLADDRIRARIFERGVGETPSSGTGASGAAVASVLAGGQSPVAVLLDGGTLLVRVEEDLRIELSGTAEMVERLEIDESLLALLAECDS